MRLIVAILAVLVFGKLYTEYRLYRSATSEAIVAAYRDKAIAACRESGNELLAGPAARAVWTKPSEVSVRIGRDDLGIAFWETGHALWPAAYAQAYLILAAPGNSTLRCTYDITARRANIWKKG